MGDFLYTLGLIFFVIAVLGALFGLFLLINFIAEKIVRKNMEKAERTALVNGDINIDDNENDELIAVITAAITVALDSDVKKESGMSSKQDNGFIKPADSHAPFVIRKIRPL